MSDEKDGNGGAWARVPTWDGSPQTWRGFKREMDWWCSALDLASTTKYNLAARWLLRQSGVVRQRGEEFTPQQLEHQPAVTAEDPETKEQVVITPANPLAGLQKLMKALEEINGKTTLDKRGELRNQFYLELRRRPGERIAEFSTRFRTLVSDLRTEGVQLPSGELGWFYKSKLGLDALRTQLLETALNGVEDYESIEREVLRLFKDLHAQDPLSRKPFGGGESGPPLLKRFLNQHQQGQGSPSRASSYAPSMTSSAPRSMRSSSSTTTSRASTYRFQKPFGGLPKQAMVSEAEVEIDPEEEDELVADGGDPPQATLDEVLQMEAEGLAQDLEEAAECGLDSDTLQQIEESVETAAEALLTMREAKVKLQEVKKDRGYGRASPADQKGKMNPKKQSSKHPCFDCNLPGHWAGDPECTKPGQGLGRKNKQVKQVKVTEALNTEVSPPVMEDGGHEVLAVGAFPMTNEFVAAF